MYNDCGWGKPSDPSRLLHVINRTEAWKFGGVRVYSGRTIEEAVKRAEDWAQQVCFESHHDGGPVAREDVYIAYRISDIKVLLNDDRHVFIQVAFEQLTRVRWRA